MAAVAGTRRGEEQIPWWPVCAALWHALAARFGAEMGPSLGGPGGGAPLASARLGAVHGPQRAVWWVRRALSGGGARRARPPRPHVGRRAADPDPVAAGSLVGAIARRGIPYTASPLGWWVLLRFPGGHVAEITSVEPGRFQLTMGGATGTYPRADLAIDAASRLAALVPASVAAAGAGAGAHGRKLPPPKERRNTLAAW